MVKRIASHHEPHVGDRGSGNSCYLPSHGSTPSLWPRDLIFHFHRYPSNKTWGLLAQSV